MRTQLLVLVLLFGLQQVSAQWVKLGLPGIRVNAILPDGANLYAGTSSGVFLSTDHGSSWNAINNGIVDTTVNCLLATGSGLYAGTDTSGIFLTINGGSTWSATSYPATYGGTVGYHAVYALLLNGTDLLAGAYGYLSTKFFVSTDYGSSWTAHVGPPTVGSVSALMFVGSRLLAGTESGISVSGDSGASFSAESVFPNNLVSGFTRLGTTAYAASQSGVVLSSDNGSTWSAVNTGLTNTTVNCITTDSTNLFAGTAGGVFLSANGGTSWTKVSTGLTDTIVYSLFLNGGNLYAGTKYGIWSRPVAELPLPVEMASLSAGVLGRNVMLTWTTVTEVNNYGFEVEREAVSIQQSAVSGTAQNPQFATPNAQWIVAGFVAGAGSSNATREYSFVDQSLAPGIYVYRIRQIDRDGSFKYSQETEVEVGARPTALTLDQNYPNPFNPTTKISYQLSAISNVSLKVYDVLGREVATLVSGVEAPGIHEIVFDASRLPSGAYFARLQAGGKLLMKKMELVK